MNQSMKTRVMSRANLEDMFPPPAPMTEKERAALERLLEIAQSDTGQARRVADFLLAWWNAGSCGKFDLTDLWCVDTAIAEDMVAMFVFVARVHSYPDKLGYSDQLKAIVADWRPQLIGDDA